MSKEKEVRTRNGKNYRRFTIWVEESDDLNQSKSKKTATKKSKTTNTPKHLSFKDIVNTDDKIREVYGFMEKNAPNCKKYIDLDTKVADELFTDKWGYRKLDFSRTSPDDSIRKNLSAFAKGDGIYSEISKDFVINLNGVTVNHPNEEAIKRYEESNKPKVLKSPIFWYTDNNGNRINPYA